MHLSPADEIRHALITPRLIAPHPNLAPSSVTGLEALAMQVLLRSELDLALQPMNLSGFERNEDANGGACPSTKHVRPMIGAGAPLPPFMIGITKEKTQGYVN